MHKSGQDKLADMSPPASYIFLILQSTYIRIIITNHIQLDNYYNSYTIN